MQRRQILIITTAEFALRERNVAQIQSFAPEFQVILKPRDEVAPEDVAGAEVIFGRPKPQWVADAPGVQWVQLPSAGADGWIGIRPADLLLTKASGTFGIPIAEWVLGSILMLTRNLHRYRDQQREHMWQPQEGAREIHGSTVGILGLGDIGQEVARRVKPFGCRVVGARRRRGLPLDYVDSILPLDDVVEEADFLVMALPGTDATRHVLNAERLARMKPGAYLINVGRGSTVDQDALVEALRSGRLAGAALDVTDPEPLPADSPLWGLEQVILSPHVSALSPEKNADRRTGIFCQNLRRYLAGEPLINVVDRQAGY